MNDFRITSRGNLKHELVDILLLVISAAVFGMNDWVDRNIWQRPTGLVA